MNFEIKICQNCKQEFRIEPEDFVIYKRFEVQVPKMCPTCRTQRRLMFRNERAFYKRPCDRCQKEHISMYSSNKPYTVWCHDCWFSDDWDALDYGRDYDPSRPFFEQFEELWFKVPKVSLIYIRSVNSEYTNISADSKNCYMVHESSNNENCIHGYWLQVCKDCVDVSFAYKTELSYELDDCYNSYRLFYSKGCHDSYNGYFLLDCRGCSNCIGCINLRNKQYHIFNQSVSRKTYEEFLKNARLDTWSGVKELRKKCMDFFASQPRKFAEIVNAANSSGNYIKDARNCRFVFHCFDAENSKYGVHVWRNAKDCYDVDTTGRNAERMYNSMNAGIDVSNYIGSAVCWSSSFMQYSYYCFNSNHCFGCVGLRKKDYCILNKQYDKVAYDALQARIIDDMRRKGNYGEFFPASVSAFGYNESAAQEQFPLTKDGACEQGFLWEDFPRGTYGKETFTWDKVPDSIRDFKNDSMGKEVFVCMTCKKNYRIIVSELAFYKKLDISLPRLCPDCRHALRFQARGPNRLWYRKCTCAGENSDNGVYKNTAGHRHGQSHCQEEFETSYASERPEIVYCEQCYNAEVA